MVKEKPATKICKHCKSEIPYGAKVCPQCRKKQGGILKWVIIAVVVVAIIGAASGGGGDKPKKVGDANTNSVSENSNETKQSNETESNQDEETKEYVFRKGEVSELNGVQVTLTDFTETSGSEWNSPSYGKYIPSC